MNTILNLFMNQSKNASIPSTAVEISAIKVNFIDLRDCFGTEVYPYTYDRLPKCNCRANTVKTAGKPVGIFCCQRSTKSGN